MKECAVRKRVERAFERGFKPLKPFNRCAPFNPPLRLLRDAGENQREVWNGLNFLNDLNGPCLRGRYPTFLSFCKLRSSRGGCKRCPMIVHDTSPT